MEGSRLEQLEGEAVTEVGFHKNMPVCVCLQETGTEDAIHGSSGKTD